MSRKQLAVMLSKDLMNQANHRTPLLSPITFITSLRRFSFSYTIDLIIMELVYTQDKTINKGNVLDKAMMNLKRARKFSILKHWRFFKNKISVSISWI